MQKHTLLLSFILSVFLIATNTTAAEFESDEYVHISSIHVIDGDLYTWGEKVTIDGEVKGDLLGGGETVTINGSIDNSTMIFANKFTHNGEINGSLRLFVNNGLIDGLVARSCLFLCNEIQIGKNAVIGNDVYFRGGNINIEGVVHGDVDITAGGTKFATSGLSINTAEGVYISGTIDGDLTINAKKIHIIPPALIKGDFKYISKNQANIDINSGVTILGNTTWDLPENVEDKNESLLLTTVKSGSKFLAAFLFGLLLMLIGKRYISSMVFQLQNRFAISAAVGFLSLAVLVVFIIILILTFVLLALGFTLLAKGEAIGGTIILALSTIMVPISSVTIVTLSTMIYTGKVIMALMLGFTIVSKLKSNPTYLSKSQLFLGLFIMYILFALPYIGTLLFIIISLIGVGAIILGIKDCNKGLDSKKVSDQAGV